MPWISHKQKIFYIFQPESDYTESAKIVQTYFADNIAKYFSDHQELAESLLATEVVMNIPLLPKKRLSLTDNPPVMHIS